MVSACIKPSSTVDNIVLETSTKAKKPMDFDKLSEHAIKQQLRAVRDANLKAQKEENILNKLISDLYPNLELKDTLTNAKNASNLNDAISYYIHNGEYDTKSLVKEIISAGRRANNE